MARKLEARLPKRAGFLDSMTDLVALSSPNAEIDAFYGESLRALLPQRLADLAPRFARAA
ncbi:MAG TPA: hypothetical protein VLV50_05615 [Stellaceae bacterium]|nr:hypothetical protein [Stellaceae bacterium]